MGTDRASGQSQPDKDEPIEERPKADETFGLFYAPTMGESGSGFFVPMHPLKVDPGAPGPGDDWQLPSDEAATKGPDR